MEKETIFKADPFIEILGLERCEFDDECDYCKDPKHGSYAKIYYPGDDNPETEYYICGGCVIKSQQEHRGRFVLPPLNQIILPF